MKIPNCESAYIDIRKLRDYCLNPAHPEGKHKARVFLATLSLSQNDAEDLERFLYQSICDDNAIEAIQDEYGERFYLDAEMEYNQNVALVRSAWMIRQDEDFPRLISCYVYRGN